MNQKLENYCEHLEKALVCIHIRIEYEVIAGPKAGFTVRDEDKSRALLIEELQSLRQQMKVQDMSQQSVGSFLTNEERFRFLTKYATDMIYRMSLPSGCYEYVSPAAIEIFGYTPEEFINSPMLIQKAIHPDWHEYFKKQWELLNAGKMPPTYEYQIVHGKSGKTRWLKQHNFLIQDKNGQAIAIEGIVTDITKHKERDTGLRIAKENLSIVFETMDDGVYIVNKHFDIQYVNPVLTKEFGDYKGIKCYKYFHRREDACPWCKNTEVFAGKSVRWEWYSTINQKTYDLFDTPIKNPDGSILKLEIFRDITERKKAETIISEQARLLDLIFKHSLDSIVILDKDYNFIRVSDTYAEACQKELSEFQGRNHFEMFPSNFKNEADEAKKGKFIYQRSARPFEFLDHPEWGTTYWDLGLVPILDKDEEVELFLFSLKDVTEHKLAETQRDLLTSAVEQSAETIVITDPKGIIQYVNPAFEAITGFSRAETLGKNPRMLKSGQHNKSFYDILWGTITKGKVWKGEISNRKKSGELFKEEVSITPVFDNAGTISHFVAVKRDITKEEELKQQVSQAQKMESIGRLAGGIAHDFNNMLSVILGYSELALTQLSPSDPVYSSILEVNNAGQRSAALTHQLLAFSRKQTIAPKVIDLNDAVANILKMLHRLIGEDIDLVWKPGANLGTTLIDPAQVDQILANLCVNSRDAIDDVGRVTIETKNVLLDDAFCRIHAYAEPGSYIQLTVSDDGCGMENDVLDKVFEPFFTTKALGEGTGLGLATVYGIVKQNNGLINVYSEPGEGTTFKLYFHHHVAEEMTAAEEQTKKLPRGNGETVLVTEDEPAILELAKVMLEHLGYNVITANTPNEALEKGAALSSKLDLLITDVVMPQMNGKELSIKLRSLCPKMKTLYMSGYTAHAIAHRGVLDDGINFLNKPFAIHDLAVKIREALGDR